MLDKFNPLKACIENEASRVSYLTMEMRYRSVPDLKKVILNIFYRCREYYELYYLVIVYCGMNDVLCYWERREEPDRRYLIKIAGLSILNFS